MQKVVVISDGVDFEIDQFKIDFVTTKKLPALSNFFRSESLDNLYQNDNKEYHLFLEWFRKTYGDYDILICDQINPFHPEWLAKHFKNCVKIYGMIDDPVCTYHRTLSQIWAFDGVFYVSPGYNQFLTTKELIQQYNSKIESYFLPHARYNSITSHHLEMVQKSFENRIKGILYVGEFYDSKIDRIIKLKKVFGSEFDVYGRWPYKGYMGYLRALKLKSPFFHKVNSLTEAEKFSKYHEYKICFNMHWNIRRETGNMRMYQAPFHGMMLLCDKAAKDQNEAIFTAEEAVYYDDIDDAIDKGRFYLKNDEARIKIARKGFEKACNEYNSDKIWKNFLTWASALNSN